MTDRVKGGFALFSSSVILASYGPLIRILAEMFGNYAQVAIRISLTSIFLLIFGLIFGKIRKFTRAQIFLAISLGVASAGGIIFFTLGVVQVKIATAAFLLFASSMISTLILGKVFFKETLGFRKIIVLGLSFIGLFLFADPQIVFSFGMIMCLLSGIFVGIGYCVRKGLKHVDRTTVLLYQLVTTGIIASILMLFTAEPIIKVVSVTAIVILVVFAIAHLAVSYLLLFGFQNFDVNIGTVILSLELFFATIFGYILYGEILAMNELIGGFMILVASILSTWEFKKAT